MKANQLQQTTYEQINFMPEWKRVLDALPTQTDAVLWDADNPREIEIVCKQDISLDDVVKLFNVLHPDEIQINGATAWLYWN